MTLTENYSFDKSKRGHQDVDDDIGRIADNLDLIDTEIHAREDSIDDLESLADGKIIVGDEGVATDVAMGGDVTIVNTGETTIGDTKVTLAMLATTLSKGVVTFGNIALKGTEVWKLEFPFKVTIDKVNTVVSIVLSDHATSLTLKNHAGTTMENGGITIDALAAVGDVDTASPTLSNVIDAGESMQFVSNGACSSGKVIAVVHYTRTA